MRLVVAIAATVLLVVAVQINVEAQERYRTALIGTSGADAVSPRYGLRSTVGQPVSGGLNGTRFGHGAGFWFIGPSKGRPTSVETPSTPTELPRTIELDQNYPNPFNPSTTIVFGLPERSRVVLEVYNILGQRVALLVDELKEAGTHKVDWNAVDDRGRPAASGVYVYRLVAGDAMQTRTMTLLK